MSVISLSVEEAYEMLGIPHDYRAILRSGDHFQLEKWGATGNAKNINKWVNDAGPMQAEIRRSFLRYHINNTTGIFTWKNKHQYY